MQLALSAEETAARGGYGQERYEKMDFQQKVRHSGSCCTARCDGMRWLQGIRCVAPQPCCTRPGVLAALDGASERMGRKGKCQPGS